jgi:hypothetical protein
MLLFNIYHGLQQIKYVRRRDSPHFLDSLLIDGGEVARRSVVG